MATEPAAMIKLRSSDGVLLEISERAAQQSLVINTMLSDIRYRDESTEIPITEVSSRTLQRVITWCEHSATQLIMRERQREERRAARRQKLEAQRQALILGSDEASQSTDPAPVPNDDDSDESDGSGGTIDSNDTAPLDNAGYLLSSPENMTSVVPEWDRIFLGLFTKEELFATLEAANYLEINELFVYCSNMIGESIAHLSTQEMREYFGVQNDLTAEQEAQLIADHQWADPYAAWP
ncbi:Skp1 family, dimerization domain-containing protein [Daldinia sp. FL1419]|nr:Skp1 family, dimerization domain-containing protein [Daldinia sp. FL1419]